MEGQGRLAIESALSIRIVDKDNAELSVDKDKDVVGEVPARGAGMDGSLAVYSYDEKEERWVEEGMAERVERAGLRRYRANIEHLSWWSYGKFYSDVGCLRACVEDGDGKAIKGAQVWIVGASLPGVSTFFTGTDGCGQGDAIAGAQVAVVAQAQSLVSSAKLVTVDAAGKACKDAGTLELGSVSNGDCPSSFQRCGNSCVDATNSNETCPAADAGVDSSMPPIGATISVVGLVTDRFDLPIAGVDLRVDGQKVKSGSDGKFSATGVRVPYAIMTYAASPAAGGADLDQTVYLGLTRANPKLISDSVASDRSASLAGTAKGVVYPVPAGHRAEISCDGMPSISRFSAIQNPGNTGGWTSTGQRWRGDPSISCTLFAIQFQFKPIAFTGMASKVIMLQDGMSYGSPETDLTLVPVTTHTLSGNITVPVGASIDRVSLGLGTSNHTTQALDEHFHEAARTRRRLACRGIIRARDLEHAECVLAHQHEITLAFARRGRALSRRHLRHREPACRVRVEHTAAHRKRLSHGAARRVHRGTAPLLGTRGPTLVAAATGHEQHDSEDEPGIPEHSRSHGPPKNKGSREVGPDLHTPYREVSRYRTPCKLRTRQVTGELYWRVPT